MADASVENSKTTLFIKWLYSFIITFLLFMSIIAWVMIKQDIDYAKGNSYAAEHISETILYSLKGSVFIAALLTVTAGQIVFWIAHLIHQNMVLRGNKAANSKLFVIIVPIVTVVIAVAVFILTMPLWFKLGG